MGPPLCNFPVCDLTTKPGPLVLLGSLVMIAIHIVETVTGCAIGSGASAPLPGYKTFIRTWSFRVASVLG